MKYWLLLLLKEVRDRRIRDRSVCLHLFPDGDGIMVTSLSTFLTLVPFVFNPFIFDPLVICHCVKEAYTNGLPGILLITSL